MTERLHVPESQFNKDLKETFLIFLTVIKDIYVTIQESQGHTVVVFDLENLVIKHRLIDMIQELGIVNHTREYQESHYLTSYLIDDTLFVDTRCPSKYYDQGVHEKTILKNIEEILGE